MAWARRSELLALALLALPGHALPVVAAATTAEGCGAGAAGGACPVPAAASASASASAALGPILLQARTDFQKASSAAPPEAQVITDAAAATAEIAKSPAAADPVVVTDAAEPAVTAPASGSMVVAAAAAESVAACSGTVRWSAFSGKCLDVPGGQPANGNRMQFWDCQPGNSNQAFLVPSSGTGVIRWAANPRKCLDVVDGRGTNGNRVQLWDCDAGNPNQQFVAPRSQSGTIRWAANPRKCLDVAEGSLANGTPLQIWDCSGDQSPNRNQLFASPCQAAPATTATTATTTTTTAPGGGAAPAPAPTAAPGATRTWTPSGQLVGSGWCQGEVPAAGWILRSSCGGTAPLRVKVLTYNLFWWNLFDRRGGNDRSAGRLIASAGQSEPYDFMGFQECDDIGRVLRDAGLESNYAGSNPGRSVAFAYRTSVWDLLASGQDEVAEDQPEQHYGRRAVTWARLRHRASQRTVLFMNHHGPLRVGSGGICGGQATAYNLLRVASRRSGPDDSIVLVGDFNSGSGSATVQVLDNHLFRVASGTDFGGVDNVYTNCAGALASWRNLGKGGSDHDAIEAVLQL